VPVRLASIQEALSNEIVGPPGADRSARAPLPTRLDAHVDPLSLTAVCRTMHKPASANAAMEHAREKVGAAFGRGQQAYPPLVRLPHCPSLLPRRVVDDCLPAARNQLPVEDTAADVGRVVKDPAHLSRGPLLGLTAKVPGVVELPRNRYWETPPFEYLWKMVLTIAASGLEIT
jgi:hypothetical protein